MISTDYSKSEDMTKEIFKTVDNIVIRGFHDGVTEEHDRIMSILERKEKENEQRN